MSDRPPTQYLSGQILSGSKKKSSPVSDLFFERIVSLHGVLFNSLSLGVVLLSEQGIVRYNVHRRNSAPSSVFQDNETL